MAHPKEKWTPIIGQQDKCFPGSDHLSGSRLIIHVIWRPPVKALMPSFCIQACLRPRDRFWDIPVPKIDSAFDNLLVPQPSWSPSTTQQLRKLVAAPYLAPNDWTPRSEAYFVFPLAQGTPGKQCGLAATGVYQPSLRSPWLAALVDRLAAFFKKDHHHPLRGAGTGAALRLSPPLLPQPSHFLVIRLGSDLWLNCTVHPVPLQGKCAPEMSNI